MFDKVPGIKYMLLSCIVLLTALHAPAQRMMQGDDSAYGPDPILYNGKIYSYFLPRDIGGHPFLQSPAFSVGVITVRGVTFQDVEINYDLINQALLLKFTDVSGTIRIIEISQAWLESFALEGRYFELAGISDDSPRIFEVLGDGPVKIYRHWKKSIELDHSYGAQKHIIPQAIKEQYLYIGGTFSKFSRNKGFASCFGPEETEAVRKYLRQQGINVKTADDMMMTKLLGFCNKK